MTEKTNQKELDFLLNLTKVAKKSFLSSWLSETYEEIQSEETKVQRKKLPRKGPKPLQRNKQMLALAKAVSGKVNLKYFAEIFDESYGVVRQWSKNKEIEKQKKLFAYLFCLEFLEEIIRQHETVDNISNYEELTNKKKDISSHLSESKLYSSDLQNLIIHLMDTKLVQIPDHIETIVNNSLYKMLRSWEQHDIYNPPKLLADKKRLVDGIILDTKYKLTLGRSIFEKLETAIENREVEDAMLLVKTLTENFIFSLESVTKLKLDYLLKGMKKQEQEELKNYAEETIEKEIV